MFTYSARFLNNHYGPHSGSCPEEELHITQAFCDDSLGVPIVSRERNTVRKNNSLIFRKLIETVRAYI